MPVMVQGIVNGLLHFWSDEPVDIVDIYGPTAPEHVYLPRVVSIDEVRFGSDSLHGGYVRLTYGTLTLTHEVFTTRVGDWPPPRRIAIAVWYTTAPQHTQLFEGAAQLDRITSEGVVYALRPLDEFDAETDEVEYKDTLVNIFTAACTTLGLTLDATDARPISPGISYVAKGKQLLIDSLDHMARWACHRFWVHDGTLYLSDILTPHGTDISLTSRDIESSEYAWNQPYRQLRADYTQPYMRNLKLVLQSVDGGTNQAVIAEIKTSRSQGGALVTGPAIIVSSEQAGNPGTYLRDNNTATSWANNVTTNPVGGALPVWIQIGVATGTIGEYALTARNLAAPTMPAKWDLYGYHVDEGKYQQLTTVESTGWGALEERRFPVPVDANWPVEVPGSYYYGDVYTVSPACHRIYSAVYNFLRVIRDVIERPVIHLSLPLPSAQGNYVLRTPPTLGQRILLTDTSLADSETGLPVSTGWLHVDGIGYDFVNHRCQIYGMGTVAAGASVMSTSPVSLYRLEPYAGEFLHNSMDPFYGGADDLVKTGAVASVYNVSIEGEGCAYLSQSDVQVLSVAEAALPAAFPFKSGTTNRTMTLSLRVRFAKGHAADTVLLAQKYTTGGFRLVKNADGTVSVVAYDTAERTVIGGAAGTVWRANTWYHVVLQISSTPATLMGTVGRQWAVSVFDESRDWWLIYPGGGTFTGATLAVTSAALQIGGTTARWYGWVDEIAVYNTILPLDELILLRERTAANLYTL
ncbi:MAG: hypothetical protein RBU35_22245 [Anaerolineae bacterium]|jgi:hypothetical protein|nr:hypothetical protein [Anaerolineae bacterium]